jgi:cell division initiation protein
MTYTPVEIRHVKLRNGLFGYRRAPVDLLLEEIAESFETVWRDRADQADRVDLLEVELKRYREIEALLRATLVSAERAAHELRDQAKREAESIVSEAQAESREITRTARGERDHLVREARRARLLLHAALDAIEESDSGPLELDEPPELSIPDPERETRAA